jgi:hypothetical protein
MLILNHSADCAPDGEGGFGKPCETAGNAVTNGGQEGDLFLVCKVTGALDPFSFPKERDGILDVEH